MRKHGWRIPALLLAFSLVMQASYVEARELKQDIRQSMTARRISEMNWTQDLRAMRQAVVSQIVKSPHSSREAILTALAASDGDSYVSIIPYVTTENNTRTNLGLNNYSTDSITKGLNPPANVLVGLFPISPSYDSQGNPITVGSGVFTVQANQMLQTNDIISALGGSVGTGWLLIFSDEQVTAWASVIFNSSQDPSIELAVADQVYKPAGFVESQGTVYNPLMILSSTKAGVYSSSLVVTNIGSGDGILTIKLYDHNGSLQTTLPSATIKASGMYVNSDIRAGVGDYGPIVVLLTDPISDGKSPRIVASSIVKSNANTSSFFPGFALPQPDTTSVGGYYTGTLTGTLINAQVEVYLYQERDMLYGTLDVKSGTFPLTEKSFLISGEVIGSKYLFQIQDAFDSDTAKTFFAYRFFGNPLSGSTIEGDTIYFDEQNRKDIGNFTFTRTGAIFPN